MATLPKITPAMVAQRVDGILKSLVAQNELEFNLLMLQLSNWTPAKRKQVFRKIFEALMTKGYSFDWEYMRTAVQARGLNTWGISTSTLRLKLLDKFVDKVREMDAKERFSPEKVYTLSKLHTKMLGMTPGTLKYLLDNDIVVIGAKFKLKAVKFLQLRSDIRAFRYLDRNHDKIAKLYQDYDINMSIGLNPQKYLLKGISNTGRNLNMVMDKVIKNPKQLTQDEFRHASDAAMIFGDLLENLDSDLAKIASVGVDRWIKIEDDLFKAEWNVNENAKKLTAEGFAASKNALRKNIVGSSIHYFNLIESSSSALLASMGETEDEIFDPEAVEY